MDLSNIRPRHFQLDPIDGFVAADVLLRQEPDDEEEDDEDEDRNHDEDEDDDDRNDDGYSERPSARSREVFPWRAAVGYQMRN